jgi:hypothetical protein
VGHENVEDDERSPRYYRTVVMLKKCSVWFIEIDVSVS